MQCVHSSQNTSVEAVHFTFHIFYILEALSINILNVMLVIE